ncbi:MAG: hypothetical protein U0229_22780 [Anaeromyxobacter sp.]
MLRALEVIEAVLHAAAVTPPPVSLVAASGPRRRWPAWAAALTLAVAAGGWLAWRSRPVEPPAPAARPVIVVADARNETGEPALDALAGLLVTSLEQSPRAVVLTRGRLLELARRTGAREVARMDEPLARAAGRLAGAKLVLGASIARRDGAYAVELRGTDLDRGRTLFTLQESAPDRGALLPAIDRLSDAVRRTLGEPAAEIQASRVALDRTVTRSLDVYRRYALARDHARSFRFAEAAGELAQALEQDPAFALAHVELVRIASTGTLLTEADRKEHLARARALEGRLPERGAASCWRGRRATRGGRPRRWRRSARSRGTSPRRWSPRSRAGSCSSRPTGSRRRPRCSSGRWRSSRRTRSPGCPRCGRTPGPTTRSGLGGGAPRARDRARRRTGRSWRRRRSRPRGGLRGRSEGGRGLQGGEIGALAARLRLDAGRRLRAGGGGGSPAPRLRRARRITPGPAGGSPARTRGAGGGGPRSPSSRRRSSTPATPRSTGWSASR